MRHGVRVLGLADTEPGSSWTTALAASIQQVDLVIAVLTHRLNTNTIFELGLAIGYGKPVLVFAPAKGDVLPSDLQGLPIVRTSLQNREAIDFAIAQILARSPVSMRSEGAKARTPVERPLNAGNFRNRLREASRELREHELASLIVEALRETGVEVVAEAPVSDRRIDLVIWSDGLQPYVGNPFPIEIKTRLPSRDAARSAIEQAAAGAQAIGSRWAMLLYVDGPSKDDRIWLSHPAVLSLRIDELFRDLEERSFPDIVRTLRNRRMHGFDD